MKNMTVVFSEPLHHICLMNGLKKTYGRMPFLNKRVLEVRGKVVTTDNVIAPPPMMSSPNRRSCMRGTRNMVGISYWKDSLSLEYREDMCSTEDITVFVNNLIEDYLHFRHPFMKTVIEGGKVLEAGSRQGKGRRGYILGNEVIRFKTLNRILVEETGCQSVKFFLPIELAERELGYTTRSLEVTLRDQIQWLKENWEFRFIGVKHHVQNSLLNCQLPLSRNDVRYRVPCRYLRTLSILP